MGSPCGVHKLVGDICLIAHDQVLFARYRDVSGYDGERGWFLPDDFLHHAEHPEEAVRRILLDQAGLSAPEIHLSHIESFEGHGFWHLIFHYAARLTTVPAVVPGENVSQLEWFPLEMLPPADHVGHGGWALETLETVLGQEDTPSGSARGTPQPSG
jgi:ADP-ribose pyrophosphatase YjhB (NUDIX family)